ncbi:MAG: response regulator transcription factor [Deinococcales bacterium]
MEKRYTILIVDDKLSITQMLKEYLEEQGFDTLVADNGRNALYTARHHKPDLILLDIMMPQMNGYGFIELYRKESHVPIILLTAKLEEEDKVLGLNLGADDYVTKPFGLAELLARIRAVLRRLDKANLGSEVLRFGDLSLDIKAHRLELAGESIALTPSEFILLRLFMEQPKRVFSRLELLEALQEDDFEGSENTINVHIRNLRRKLEPNPKTPQYIETVFGLGYRFKS